MFHPFNNPISIETLWEGTLSKAAVVTQTPPLIGEQKRSLSPHLRLQPHSSQLYAVSGGARIYQR